MLLKAPLSLLRHHSNWNSLFTLVITSKIILVFISSLEQKQVKGNFCTRVLEHFGCAVFIHQNVRKKESFFWSATLASMLGWVFASDARLKPRVSSRQPV